MPSPAARFGQFLPSATVRFLQAAAKAERQIAAEAAQVGAAQLDGVGSATWRALWDPAKAYSPGQIGAVKAVPSACERQVA